MFSHGVAVEAEEDVEVEPLHLNSVGSQGIDNASKDNGQEARQEFMLIQDWNQDLCVG